MANTDYEFIYTVEDYTGVSTGVVMDAGQARWFDTVTGHDSTEVIQLTGDGAASIATLLSRHDNITFVGAKDFSGAVTFSGGTIDASLPSGYLYGLETSQDTDTDHDVLIAVGKCRDYADTANLALTTAMTKQIDATWAAGDDAGGMFTGTVAVDTTYHLFIIKKDSDDSIDAGFDTDIDCSNIPTGYTAYRRIASFLTDASSNIIAYIQSGDIFELKTYIQDVQVSSLSTSRTSYTLSVPSGISPVATISMSVLSNVTTNILVFPTDVDDMTPALSGPVTLPAATGSTRPSVTMDIRVDSSSEISIKRADTDLSGSFNLSTHGYKDNRGQYGGK